MGNLSPELTGPVALALAKPVQDLPGPHGVPGGSRYELKWDGFRAAAVVRDGRAWLWSRNGKDFTAKFPDVQVALANQVGIDCVLDGELVVWTGERLDFDALQARNVTKAAAAIRELARKQPASLVVFDLLAVDSVDIRPMRWTARRNRLESLAATWKPPLQLSPVTSDEAEAREWLESFKHARVEGLMVKGASSRYQPGRREWLKWKTRDTVECIVGAVTGSLKHPTDLVVGLYRGGELTVVGRTVRLHSDQATAVAALLRPAGAKHPWPDEVSTHWGSGSKTVIVKVRPTVVVEVEADPARQAGRFRHPVRLVRHRSDLTPSDIEGLPGD